MSGTCPGQVQLRQRGSAKTFAASGRLIRVLALSQRVVRASPLVSEHVSGELNALGDILSSSFGYSKLWHCTNDSKFLSLINYQFALSHQHSWQGFHLSLALSTKVVSKLGTKASLMGEWKQLRRIWKLFGGSDIPIANLSELNHTWRK